MERNPKDPRSPRSTRQTVGQTMSTTLEDQDDEITSPGVEDPNLREALDSLRRTQQVTRSHASNIEALLVKKKTPLP